MLSNLPARLGSAMPELFASALYFVAWFSPASLSSEVLRSLVLAMLVEFLVLHSTAFLTVFAATRVASPKRAGLAILGLGALYFLFAGGFALAFHSWMPIYVIGWLVGSRLVTLVIDPRGEDESGRQMGMWALGTALYLLLAFATTIPPIPALGLDDTAVARMDLPGSGLWISEPQRPIAMGAFYFGLLGLAELRGSRADGPTGRPPG
jgi:hypothetical protein